MAHTNGRNGTVTRDEECPGCGSNTYREGSLKECPHCHAKKCSGCDMGDDVSCITCEGAED